MDGRAGLGALCRGKTELEKGIRGRQLNANAAKSPSAPARPLSGHNPSPPANRFLFPSVKQSFSTASFNLREMTSGGHHCTKN